VYEAGVHPHLVAELLKHPHEHRIRGFDAAERELKSRANAGRGQVGAPGRRAQQTKPFQILQFKTSLPNWGQSAMWATAAGASSSENT
jgi:hypothetical protein